MQSAPTIILFWWFFVIIFILMIACLIAFFVYRKKKPIIGKICLLVGIISSIPICLVMGYIVYILT